MPDLYEYVLKEVVSFFVRAKELPDMMIEPFGIVVDYRPEGLLIRSLRIDVRILLSVIFAGKAKIASILPNL